LEEFPEQGVKNLAICTPAFVSDCLETLEEISMEGREEFLKAGGESFTYIPCLNDRQDWVNVLVKWLKGWQNN
ncbi:ferrochelatase, partial [Algoriella sp.]|uniref:ferrochelatase n=1 Tax=Algoriella sp. TaxID=1872434 RepID=UPI001B010978